MNRNRNVLFIPGCYFRFVGLGESYPMKAFKIISYSKDPNIGPDDRVVLIKFRTESLNEVVRLSFLREHCEVVPDILGLIEVGE